MRSAAALAMTSHRPDLKEQLARAPERQPYDIERLLHWTYHVQQADMASSGESEASSWSSMVYSVRATVPCAGFRFVVARDALTVHDVVKRTLKEPMQILVIAQARKGEPPDWCAGVVPRPVMRVAMDARTRAPKWNHRERRAEPFMRWLDREGAELPQGAAAVHNYGYCVVEYQPSWEFIEMNREIYRLWHRAMGKVLEALGEVTLERWKPHATAIPYQPWERT